MHAPLVIRRPLSADRDARESGLRAPAPRRRIPRVLYTKPYTAEDEAQGRTAARMTTRDEIRLTTLASSAG